MKHHPNIVEDEYFKPHLEAVISLPMRAPDNAIFRVEGAIPMLKRIKLFNEEWIKPGHIKGDNTHNVSATVYVKDDEWETVGNWMWDNRDCYNGLAVLPYDGGTYKQMPFEEIDEAIYEAMRAAGKFKELDLTQVIEDQDNTDLKGEVACAGGACSI